MKKKLLSLTVLGALLISIIPIQPKKASAEYTIFTGFSTHKIKAMDVPENAFYFLIDIDLPKTYVKDEYKKFAEIYWHKNFLLKFISYRRGERAKVRNESTYSLNSYLAKQATYVYQPDEPGYITRKNGFFSYVGPYKSDTTNPYRNLVGSKTQKDDRWDKEAPEIIGTNGQGGEYPNKDFPWYVTPPKRPFNNKEGIKLDKSPTKEGVCDYERSLIKEKSTAQNIKIKLPNGSNFSLHDYILRCMKQEWPKTTGLIQLPVDKDQKKYANVKAWDPNKIPGGSDSKMYEYMNIVSLPTFYTDGLVVFTSNKTFYGTYLLPALTNIDTVDLSVSCISHSVEGYQQQKSIEDTNSYRNIWDIINEKGLKAQGYIDRKFTLRLTAKDLGMYMDYEKLPPLTITVDNDCKILREGYFADVPNYFEMTYKPTSNSADNYNLNITEQTVIKNIDFRGKINHTMDITFTVRQDITKYEDGQPIPFDMGVLFGGFAIKATKNYRQNSCLYVYDEDNVMNNAFRVLTVDIGRKVASSPLYIEEDEITREYRYLENISQNSIMLTKPSDYDWLSSYDRIYGYMTASKEGDTYNILKEIRPTYTNFCLDEGTITQPQNPTSFILQRPYDDNPKMKTFYNSPDDKSRKLQMDIELMYKLSPPTRTARKLVCTRSEGAYTDSYIAYRWEQDSKGKWVYVPKVITYTAYHYHDSSCYSTMNIEPTMSWKTLKYVYNIEVKSYNGNPNIREIEPDIQDKEGDSSTRFLEEITLDKDRDLRRIMYHRIVDKNGNILSETKDTNIPAQYNRTAKFETQILSSKDNTFKINIDLGKNKATDKSAKRYNVDVYKAGYEIVPSGNVRLNIDMIRYERPMGTGQQDFNKILDEMLDNAYIEGNFDVSYISGNKTYDISFSDALERFKIDPQEFVKVKLNGLTTKVLENSLTDESIIDSAGTKLKMYLERQDVGTTNRKYNETYVGDLQKVQRTMNLQIDLNPMKKKFMLYPKLPDGDYYLEIKTRPISVQIGGNTALIPSITLYRYNFKVMGSSYDDLSIDESSIVGE